MLGRFESFVAYRYLRSKRKEVFISIITVISVLGVAVSVMVLDIVLSIMTGFEAELKQKLVDANAHILIRRFDGLMENHDDVIHRITEVPGVVSAFPYTYNQAMISTAGGARGVLIRGISDTDASRQKFENMEVQGQGLDGLFHPAVVEIIRPDGSPDEVELPPILVGRELYRKLGLLIGSPVTLFAPHFTASPQGLMPKLRRFVPVGHYHSGLTEYESGLAYMALDDAQAFFGLGKRVSGIEVTVTDMFEAKRIGSLILDKLGGSASPFTATDWTEPNRALWEALKLEKRVYFIVLLLLILVASFSIVSTLVMVVMEKSRDIAILKSLGATHKSIMIIFLLQGTFIGFSGVILGTLFGYLGCLGLRIYGFPIDETVFSLAEVPVHIVPANFALVAVSAFVITVLAGFYPAIRASRLRPAEAFRYE